MPLFSHSGGIHVEYSKSISVTDHPHIIKCQTPERTVKDNNRNSACMVTIILVKEVLLACTKK